MRHQTGITWVVTAIVASGAICVGLRFESRHDQIRRDLADAVVEAESPAPNLASRSGFAGSPPAQLFDLTRLPRDLRRVVSVILLMPIGALVTCVFRNLIGIQTSGRFTPMLVALSFVFGDWLTGLVVFGAVVALGLVTRNLVDRLKLLVLPRLSVILTIVVCSIAFGVSLLDYYRLAPGVHAVLLPMVILTMIVERFYVTGQEEGTRAAIERLAGTVVVGFFCYLVLQWKTAGHVLLAYPEAHLFTIAVLIAIGRYTGYQLLELWRFRDAVASRH